MSLTRKITKSGNSAVVVIPPTLLELLGWKTMETNVVLTVDGEKLVIQREAPPKFKLFGERPA